MPTRWAKGAASAPLAICLWACGPTGCEGDWAKKEEEPREREPYTNEAESSFERAQEGTEGMDCGLMCADPNDFDTLTGVLAFDTDNCAEQAAKSAEVISIRPIRNVIEFSGNVPDMLIASDCPFVMIKVWSWSIQLSTNNGRATSLSADQDAVIVVAPGSDVSLPLSIRMSSVRSAWKTKFPAVGGLQGLIKAVRSAVPRQEKALLYYRHNNSLRRRVLNGKK